MIYAFSHAAGRVLAIDAALLATAIMAGAQTAITSEVRGRVFNASSGRNLNTAQVTVKGTTIGGGTDPSGEYRLQLPPGDVELADSVRMNWHQGPGRIREPKVDDPRLPKSWSSSRTVVSAEAEYRITNRLSLYGAANNLTDTPGISRSYGSITPEYSKNPGLSVYGTDFTLGLWGTF